MYSVVFIGRAPFRYVLKAVYHDAQSRIRSDSMRHSYVFDKAWLCFFMSLSAQLAKQKIVLKNQRSVKTWQKQYDFVENFYFF